MLIEINNYSCTFYLKNSPHKVLESCDTLWAMLREHLITVANVLAKMDPEWIGFAIVLSNDIGLENNMHCVVSINALLWSEVTIASVSNGCSFVLL